MGGCDGGDGGGVEVGWEVKAKLQVGFEVYGLF